MKNFKKIIYFLVLAMFISIPSGAFASGERIELKFIENSKLQEKERANPRYLVELAKNEMVGRSSSKYVDGFYFTVERGEVYANIPKRSKNFKSRVSISSYIDGYSRDLNTLNTEDKDQKIFLGYAYLGGEYKMSIESVSFDGTTLSTDSVTYNVGKDTKSTSDFYQTRDDDIVRRLASQVRFKKTESGYEITTPNLTKGYSGELQVEVSKSKSTGRMNLKFETEKTVYFTEKDLDLVEASALIKIKNGNRTVATDFAYASDYVQIQENKGFNLLNEASNSLAELRFYMHEGRKFVTIPAKTENLEATFKIYTPYERDTKVIQAGDKKIEFPLDGADNCYLVATYKTYDTLVLEKGIQGFGNNPFHYTDFPRTNLKMEDFSAERKDTTFKTENIVDEKKNVNLTDIKGHWAEKNIERFVKEQIIMGYPDGTFKPEKTLTYREALSMIKRLGDKNVVNLSVAKNNNPKFTKGTWGDDDVRFVLSRLPVNILENVDLETEARRDEISYVMAHFFNYRTGRESVSKFTDNNNINYLNEVELLVSNGTINGYPDGSFKPQNRLKRCEFVTMISNIPNFTK